MVTLKKILRGFMMILALFALCSTVFASAESPTDEEVIAAYNNANKVYNWFGLVPLPTDGRQKKETGYMIYYNVNYPNIRTMSDLRREMNAVFTSDLTNSILGNSRTYREFGGGLYVAPSGLRANVFAGQSSFSVNRLNADSINLQVTTEILENPLKNKMDVVRYETKDFSYVNTPIGWRFATFTRVR